MLAQAKLAKKREASMAQYRQSMGDLAIARANEIEEFIIPRKERMAAETKKIGEEADTEEAMRAGAVEYQKAITEGVGEDNAAKRAFLAAGGEKNRADLLLEQARNYRAQADETSQQMGFADDLFEQLKRQRAAEASQAESKAGVMAQELEGGLGTSAADQARYTADIWGQRRDAGLGIVEVERIEGYTAHLDKQSDFVEERTETERALRPGRVRGLDAAAEQAEAIAEETGERTLTSQLRRAEGSIEREARMQEQALDRSKAEQKALEMGMEAGAFRELRGAAIEGADPTPSMTESLAWVQSIAPYMKRLGVENTAANRNFWAMQHFNISQSLQDKRVNERMLAGARADYWEESLALRAQELAQKSTPVEEVMLEDKANRMKMLRSQQKNAEQLVGFIEGFTDEQKEQLGFDPEQMLRDTNVAIANELKSLYDGVGGMIEGGGVGIRGGGVSPGMVDEPISGVGAANLPKAGVYYGSNGTPSYFVGGAWADPANHIPLKDLPE
jgi:hypothetical protein